MGEELGRQSYASGRLVDSLPSLLRSTCVPARRRISLLPPRVGRKPVLVPARVTLRTEKFAPHVVIDPVHIMAVTVVISHCFRTD